MFRTGSGPIVAEVALPNVIETAWLAVRGLAKAHANGIAAEHLQTLPPEIANALWRCVRRLGWWAPADRTSDQERLLFWLFREDTTRHDPVHGREYKETPDHRILTATTQMDVIVKQLLIPCRSCLDVYGVLTNWLQSCETGPGQRRFRPFNFGGLQPGNPWEDDCKFAQLCFDDARMSEIIGSFGRQMGMSPEQTYGRTTVSLMNDESLHVQVKQHRAGEGIHESLKLCRSIWLSEALERQEIPTGWKITDNAVPHPITNARDLRKWLSAWLEQIHKATSSEDSWNQPDHYLNDIQRELRNARIWLRERNEPIPDCFQDEPADIGEAERRLEYLIYEFFADPKPNIAAPSIKVLSQTPPDETAPTEEAGSDFGERKPDPLPGPEFTMRTDVRNRYFKVWAFLNKPGNAGKSNIAVSKAVQVNKDQVGKIRKETRPPTPDEIAEHRNNAKKR